MNDGKNEGGGGGQRHWFPLRASLLRALLLAYSLMGERVPMVSGFVCRCGWFAGQPDPATSCLVFGCRPVLSGHDDGFVRLPLQQNLALEGRGEGKEADGGQSPDTWMLSLALILWKIAGVLLSAWAGSRSEVTIDAGSHTAFQCM